MIISQVHRLLSELHLHRLSDLISRIKDSPSIAACRSMYWHAVRFYLAKNPRRIQSPPSFRKGY